MLAEPKREFVEIIKMMSDQTCVAKKKKHFMGLMMRQSPTEQYFCDQIISKYLFLLLFLSV